MAIIRATSGVLLKGSTLFNQLNEQASNYLKAIESDKQMKFVNAKGELDILKYLSLTYNVNTIVNQNFQSKLKVISSQSTLESQVIHNQIPKNMYKVCIDSVKINNRIVVKNTMQTMMLPPTTKLSEKVSHKPFKNVLTSLVCESKPDQQLLIVDIVNIGGPNISNSVQPIMNSHRMIQESIQFLQNFKAFPAMYYLNFEATRDVSPYIAIDRIQGRHFIYNNDDMILVFSHEPISNSQSDKSRPLLQISLNDKQDDIYQKGMGYGQDDSQENSSMILEGIGRARVNPTLQIITDRKGNSALLVIGGYVELGNGMYIAKRNIKVFNIGKRKMDIQPSFQIALKHPRVNPIVIRVKQSQCKDAKVSLSEDKKYLILLGGALPNIVEDRKVFMNTNTQCSVIEYDSIFNQLIRHDATELSESKTLKVLYNDKESGKNYEKLALQLAKGVFLRQKCKSNSDIRNKMFIICDKRSQLYQINAISLSENFISIFDTDSDLRNENSWSYTNFCNIEDQIVYIPPQQITPFIIETSGKNSKLMQVDELVEFNKKKKKDIFEIKPKQQVTTCSCLIF